MFAINRFAVTQDIALIEKECDVKVNLTLPEKFVVAGVQDIEEVQRRVNELSPLISSLAHSAFSKNNKSSWDLVQTLLYYWNYRDLLRIDRIKDNSPLVEYALRKIVLDEQIRNQPNYSLECFKHFTPEKAVEEMADKAYSHRINQHSLLTEMANNGIKAEAVKVFLENYYVNNRLFHLFIIALGLAAPLSRRTEIANNFFDEMGAGDHAMAHPNLFLKNFYTIGKPTSISPLPEALCLANAKMYAAFLCGDPHYGMGGFGYIELTMPEQMKKILSGLEKSGIPRSDLVFWETHISIDIEHGKAWFEEMLALIETPEQAQRCLTGGLTLLEARATMYDGILQFI